MALTPEEVLAQLQAATTDEERIAIELAAIAPTDNGPTDEDPNE